MTTDLRERMQEAIDAQDFETFSKLSDEQRENFKVAVRRGILRSGAELGELEREGLDAFVDRVRDHTEASSVDIDHESVLALCESLAESWAREPLVRKLFAAYEVEWRVTDDNALADGLVGQAIDSAIETLRPYWERH